MVPIGEALDRAGIKGDHRVDIYNRCYEAVYKAILDQKIKARKKMTHKALAEREGLSRLYYEYYKAIESPPILLEKTKGIQNEEISEEKK